MAHDHETPGALPETEAGIDELDTLDLAIEKLGPRLALDNVEGGSSAASSGCTLSGKG
ncbi:hypothetical protein [Streptomyces sedi]|uniref:hypothetical protein n=1 Tax=Streptomyces sedi TaxID=555059 RepID=UPI0014771B23|nr:hypothetical protein [Streptomyces sedi]